MKIPAGFQPMSLEEMLQQLHDPYPTLGQVMFDHLKLSEADAMTRIKALEKKDVVQFAISTALKQPAVFIAPEKQYGFDRYGSPEEFAFAESLVSFWDVTGKFDETGQVVTTSLPPVCHIHTPEGPISVIGSVAQKIRHLLTVTAEGFHAPSKAQLIEWVAAHGICDFCSDPHPQYSEIVPDFEFFPGQNSVGGWASCEKCHLLIEQNRRADLLRRSLKASFGGAASADALTDLHRKFWRARDTKLGFPKLPKSKIPHWQAALDGKVSAIELLQKIGKLPKDHPRMEEVQWMDLMDDLTALKAAEVYSFSEETMHAIMAGAKSIPHESSLESVEIPNVRAGWFWFADPYPVAPSPVASNSTAAILWSWDPHTKKPTIRFSAYVRDERMDLSEKMFPSAKWVWPLHMTFHEMIALNTGLYRKVYGKGGPFEGSDTTMMIGEKETLAVVAELSLFFLMSCLWFRQTVPGTKKKIEPTLTQIPGHIERHARKRYEKAFKATPVVQVIALRKSAKSEEIPSHTSLDTVRHLKVRFVVDGHARLQPYGPGRKEKKLIWIDPYVKGDESMPFKDKGPKVYAVVR